MRCQRCGKEHTEKQTLTLCRRCLEELCKKFNAFQHLIRYDSNRNVPLKTILEEIKDSLKEMRRDLKEEMKRSEM